MYGDNTQFDTWWSEREYGPDTFIDIDAAKKLWADAGAASRDVRVALAHCGHPQSFYRMIVTTKDASERYAECAICELNACRESLRWALGEFIGTWRHDNGIVMRYSCYVCSSEEAKSEEAIVHQDGCELALAKTRAGTENQTGEPK